MRPRSLSQTCFLFFSLFSMKKKAWMIGMPHNQCGWGTIMKWYGVDQKKVNLVLDQLEKCGFLQGVQHVSNNTSIVIFEIAKFWPFLLFIMKHVHEQQQKMLFLECPLPVLSVRINFNSFSTTLKIYAPKVPMKYSKNNQNFAMSKITIDVLFETCWTPCKKPHISSWSRTRFTFFWSTLYLITPRSDVIWCLRLCT